MKTPFLSLTFRGGAHVELNVGPNAGRTHSARRLVESGRLRATAFGTGIRHGCHARRDHTAAGEARPDCFDDFGLSVAGKPARSFVESFHNSTKHLAVYIDTLKEPCIRR
jgi:hypothetical protein